MDKKLKYLEIVIGLALVLLYVKLTGSYVAVFALLIPLLVGSWIGKYYLNKKNIKTGFVKFVLWSNIITWVIPLVAMLTIGASIQFNSKNKNKDKIKYLIIIVISFILTYINSIIGARQHLKL